MRRLSSIVFACLLAACSAASPDGCNIAPGIPTVISPHLPAGFTLPSVFYTSGGIPITNLTSSCTQSGVTVTRGGATTVYVQTGANTVTTTTGVVYEDRGSATTGTPGGDMAGCWAFSQILANDQPSPNNHTIDGVNWSNSTTPATVTIGATTAPDGTMTGDKVDAASGNHSFIYNTNGLNGSTSGIIYLTSGWALIASPTPTVTGGLWVNGGNKRGISFNNPTVWTRYQTWDDAWKLIGLFSKGFLAYNQFVDSASGATYMWGSYLAHDTLAGVTQHAYIYDTPLVITASVAQTIQLSAAQAAQIVQNGDVDVKFCWISHTHGDALYNTNDAWLWSAQSADGLMGIKYSADSDSYDFSVRGVFLGGINPVVLANTADQKEVCDRIQYKPHTSGTWNHRITVNGCASIETNGSTSGGALAAPTQAWLGSDLGSSTAALAGQMTTFTTYVGQPVKTLAAGTPEFVIVGDSIMDRVNNSSLTGGGFYTIAESRARPGIVTLAHNGDKIQDQLAAYNASPVKGNASVTAFIIRVGVNNAANGDTAAPAGTVGTMEYNYTQLFNAIHTGNPNAKIVIGTMTPAEAALTAPQYVQFTALQQWLIANSLGADAVTQQATNDLSDGTDPLGGGGGGGNISLACDVGDHLHPVNHCRDIMMVDDRVPVHMLGLI